MLDILNTVFGATFGFCFGIVAAVLVFMIGVLIIVAIVFSVQHIIGELDGSNKEHREDLRRIRQGSIDHDERMRKMYEEIDSL